MPMGVFFIYGGDVYYRLLRRGDEPCYCGRDIGRQWAADTPSGVTPKAQGVFYRYAGENLAGNQTVEKAHAALMNSEGHRANILNPNYTHIGIGIVKGGPYGVMFTQHFIGI